MPKGKLVDPIVAGKVRSLLSDDRSLRGNELRSKVETELPEFKYSLRTYQILKKETLPLLEEIKKTLHDEQWSMGNYALNGFESQYKLSAQDIEAILRVRNMLLKNSKLKNSMSVRQARWIARLWSRVDKIDFSKEEQRDKAYWLWRYSFEYAIREKVARLNKRSFDTRELDDALAQGHEEFKRAYETDVRAHWKDYESFYVSHILDESEYQHLKDGEK